MNSQEPPHLDFRIEGATAVLALNRPAKYNSMSLELIGQFEAALSEIERRPEVRAILIRANGKHFCTGADIGIVLDCVRIGTPAIEAWLERGQSLFARLESSPLPVVIAIQGLCLAGGLELMLACDIAIAAETSRIGDQHVNFGFLPGWGASDRLPRIVGERRALDLMLSGRMLSSSEALAIGLVNRVVPDAALEQEALAYCEALATRSRSGLTAMKRMVRDSDRADLVAAHIREKAAVTRQLQSDDGAEGFAAFKDKRKPVFK